LVEAITMGGLFIGKGPIVITRSALGGIDVKRSRQEQVYDGPLLVMIDRFSASASEILAGALQDYGRALIVGDAATFGKGTVQNITALRDPYGALKITIAQFYRVSGGSTQNKGVESDIALPTINNFWDVGESYLTNALPWHKLETLSYEKDTEIQSILPQLKERSEKRIATNPKFIKIQQDINEYVTKVKPKKFISILGIQEEFNKSEKERLEREAKTKQLITNAEDSQTDAENLKDESKVAENDFDSFIGKNAYLEEGITIIEDYILLTQRKIMNNSETPFLTIKEKNTSLSADIKKTVEE